MGTLGRPRLLPEPSDRPLWGWALSVVPWTKGINPDWYTPKIALEAAGEGRRGVGLAAPGGRSRRPAG